MGKSTGFLEYTRVSRPGRDPMERVRDFDELHGELTERERRCQGARCMNCGVPFCQSEFGCPLHNLIPEWNDEVYGGSWAHALSRLLKTNNFPEFTGRVCPALCEDACTCAMDEGRDNSVTVRDNELTIVEYGWEHGLMTPQPPAVRTGKRVAVIGSGPAGLAAADQLNRRGHAVTVYEKEDRPGGLLMYGIPNMKLDKSVVMRRVEKLEAEGVRFITGTKIDADGAKLAAEYDAVILCCGAGKARGIEAENADLPGVYPALEYLTAATKSLLAGVDSPISARGRNVVVIGNGDTATDCVATAIRQGAASVTQLVRKPKPSPAAGSVWPGRQRGEKTDYGQEEAVAVFGRDPRMYETTAKRLVAGEDGSLAAVAVDTPQGETELPAELLLIAAGFSGAEPESALCFGLSLNERGRLGDEYCRTDDPKIFAAGDMRLGASLVVKAIADGRAAARTVDEYLEGYTNL